MALHLFLLGLAASAGAAAGDPYEAMAVELAAAARRGGVRNLTVMPLRAAEGDADAAALILAERLAAGLSRAGEVRVVDRARLGELSDPRARPLPGLRDLVMEARLLDEILGHFRLVDAGEAYTPKSSGQRAELELFLVERSTTVWGQIERLKLERPDNLYGIEGLVTGFHAPLADGNVEVHARVIVPGTALVLGSAAAKVPRDWGKPPPGKPPVAAAGLAGAVLFGLGLAVRSLFG